MAASNTQAATLFWRLCVLRHQLQRMATEIEVLAAMAGRQEDLVEQMQEARGLVVQAAANLQPLVGHIDRPILEETRL